MGAKYKKNRSTREQKIKSSSGKFREDLGQRTETEWSVRRILENPVLSLNLDS